MFISLLRKSRDRIQIAMEPLGLVLSVLLLCLYRVEDISGNLGSIQNIAIITNSLSEHLHRMIQTNILHKCPDQFNLTIKIQLRNTTSYSHTHTLLRRERSDSLQGCAEERGSAVGRDVFRAH